MNMDDIVIFDTCEKMDFDKITAMLSQAKWSLGIKKNEVIQGATNSALVVGAFYKGFEQIGYARVISDKTRFAYISDVYVDENFRNRGIAQKMMQYILNHDSLKDVYQWLLKSYANQLYEKIGFAPISNHLEWMEIKNERPNR